MKTIILYCSRYGTTEKVAQMIADRLKEGAILLNLHTHPKPSIHGFDRVILGGSIYMGKIQKQMRLFCKDYLALLLEKEVGLFICGLYQDKQQEEFDNAYPQSLREHSTAQGLLGGALQFAKMNFLEKFIVKKIMDAKQDLSRIDQRAIDAFVKQLTLHEHAAGYTADKPGRHIILPKSGHLE